MLGYIRESVQGWIAWAIVILLIIPFALWGINEYFGSGGKLVVATVNGEEISQQDQQREFYRQRDRMRQLLGAQFDPATFESKEFKLRILDNLINKEVLIQAADDNGYRVSENMVSQFIKANQSFQSEGKFSYDVYKQLLRDNNLTIAEYEMGIQRELLSTQMQRGIISTSLVTKSELDSIIRLQEQTREIGYLVLNADNYKKEEDATEEAVNQFYKDNSERYMTPAMVSLQYLELNAKELKPGGEPTEEDLRKIYEERSSVYVTPEERGSSHIMLTIEAGASKEQIDKVKAKADEIYKKLKEGADFAELAKKVSEDPGSNQSGGDMGLMARGKTPDPAYEEALFKLAKVGDISEPVLSAFGYHIIKLNEIRETKAKPFEEVKSELIAEYKQSAADRMFFELSEKLTNMAYEVPDTLEDAAGATGLKIKTTELFPRTGGKGIAANPKVAAAAFGDDVLKNRYNSEPIEIGENHVVVVRVKDYQEAKQKSIDEVKDQIKSQIISEKAKERAEQVGKNIIEQLTKGDATPEAAAKIANVEWKKAGELKRTDRTIESRIVQKAFQMAKPVDGKSSFGGTSLANAYAVVGVSKVTDGDPSKTDEAKRVTLERNLSGIQGEAAYYSYLQDLKRSSSIVISEDNL